MSNDGLYRWAGWKVLPDNHSARLQQTTSTHDAASAATAAGDSLLVAGLLAVVGGFLDAFTYFGHGRVFANAMTFGTRDK